MSFLATCVIAWAAAALGQGCVTTDKIEFQEEMDFPPSVVSQPNAAHPLNQIARINLDDELPPGEPAEFPLQVDVREPNFDQGLEYRLFLDAPAPPAPQPFPIQQGEIDPTGFLSRPLELAVDYSLFEAGTCHKLELVVVGEFASFVEPRRPVIPGDIDQATWWVEVTDDDDLVIDRVCQ